MQNQIKASPNPGRLLAMKDVVRETSLHRATIYRRIKSGDFPASHSIGGRRVVWCEADIESWKASQISIAS